ncbi:MAG: hypothetical protein IPO08_19835 [Xanthomonadales bacterium]|nr:hypothetical protein [Xanthomonadales bacterium]
MAGLAAKDLPRRDGKGRADDWLAHMTKGAERTWTMPNGTAITLSEVSVDGNVLTFHAKVVRPSGRVVFDDDHVIVNPPIYVQDGTDADGNPIYVKNIRAVLRDIVVRNLR